MSKVKRGLNVEPLTIEKLKSYPGLENLNEREAEKIIASIEQFSLLMFQMFKRIKLDENK